LNKTKADIVVGYSDNIGKVLRKDKKNFIIDVPGEYEIKNVFIYVKQFVINNNVFFVSRLQIENVSITHLDSIPDLPQNKDFELMENTDILFIPVGGGSVLTPSKAVDFINNISPRIVVPICYKWGDMKIKLEDIDVFVKKGSISNIEYIDKFKVTKSKLPQDKMELKVLSKI
jgi:hypothetical protein